MQEVEMKAWLKTAAEKDRVRTFLHQEGKFLKNTVKNDTYFAKPGAQTFDFRLREMGGKFLVNQKQHKLVGNLEENEELEFEISDKEAFLALVEKLGYVVFIKKRKEVEMYRLPGNLLAEIVEIAELGSFLEIEWVGENGEESQNAGEKIQEIFEKLELQKNVEQRQYSVLLKNVDFTKNKNPI